jgi:hypothetical protein
MIEHLPHEYYLYFAFFVGGAISMVLVIFAAAIYAARGLSNAIGDILTTSPKGK